MTRVSLLTWLLLIPTVVIADQDSSPRGIPLMERWEVGADADGEVIFGVISGIDVDEAGNVYVADRQLTLVSVFSPDGLYLGPLGREGDGPAEYRRIGDIFAAGPGEMAVMQRMPGKIVTITSDGLPGRDIALPASLTESPAYFFKGQAAGDDVLILSNQMQRNEDEFVVNRSLMRISAAGEEKARLSQVFQETNLSDFRIDEKSHAPLVWAVSPDGHVFVNDEFDAYRIRRYDAEGSLIHTIDREYQHRSRSSLEMAENTPRMAVRSQAGDRVDAEGTPSPTDRDIQALFVRPDGSLWILTSRGAFDQEEGVLATFDVYGDGRDFSHRVALMGDGNFYEDGMRLIGHRLYLLRGLRAAQLTGRGEGDESGNAIPMSVVCYEFGR